MRWLLSLALVGIVACSSHKPKLEQPVGVTMVTGATARAAPLGSHARRLDVAGAETQLLPSLLFAEQSSVVSPTQDAALRRIAERMESGPLRGATIVAVGHSDPRGSSGEALELGLERALAVKELLIAHGAPAALVIASSSGSLTTPADWPGRRVDLLVIPAPPRREIPPAPLPTECSPWPNEAVDGCR